MTALLRGRPRWGRDYRALWLAGLVSEIGDWLLLIALPILVYQLTGSTLGTALAFLVELLPPVALGAVAGRLADRWNRRRALAFIAVIQAAGLLPLLAVHDRDDLWIIYLVICVQATLSTFAEPTRNALVPALIPAGDLVGANSLLQLTSNVGRLVGGPLGGALLALGDLRTIVVVDALSFGLAALLIMRIGPVRRARHGPPGQHDDGAEQPRHLRVALIITGLTATAQGLFVVLFLPFVGRALHGGAAEIGLLRGVQAIGAIGAGLLLGVLAGRWRPGVLVATGAGAFGVLDLMIWNGPQVTNTIGVYAVLFAVVGAPGVVLVTGLVSVLQRAAGAARTGRAFGAFTTTFAAGQGLGMIAAGLLGDRVSLIVLLNAQAGLILLASVVAAVGLRADAETRDDPRRGRRGPPTSPAPGGVSRTHSAIAGGCNRRAPIRATPPRRESVSHTACMSTPAHVE